MHVFRLHGRGGQGVNTARKILGRAAFLSGFYVQDFVMPSAGLQKVAYVKIDKNPILSRDLPEPDFVLGFEAVPDVTANVKAETVAIFNSQSPVKKKIKCYYIPATDIALAHKIACPNTTMLGALCKVFAKLSTRSVKTAAEVELRGVSNENAVAVDEGYKGLKRC